MNAQAVKRVFARSYPLGMQRQAERIRTVGAARNIRHSEGRTIIAQNMIYRRR